MSDPRSVLERESQRFIQADGAFERFLRRRDRKRRNQRIRAGVLGLAIAIAGGWLGVNAIRSFPPAPADDRSQDLENPTPTTPAWSWVPEHGASAVHRGRMWKDSLDTAVDWVDIRRMRFFTFKSTDGAVQPTWSIELAAKPPLAASLGPRLLIAYGLVLDTTSDGVADYLVGIDNNAPGPGGFHVWVTDLATGETDEQVGPPYGFPIEFGHPDETRNSRVMGFTFLPGSAPADLNPKTVRFYAWAATSKGGSLSALDYAPDRGWMLP